MLIWTNNEMALTIQFNPDTPNIKSKLVEWFLRHCTVEAQEIELHHDDEKAVEFDNHELVFWGHNGMITFTPAAAIFTVE